ncbi:MAG: DUF4377 domain-containing protein [Flavobacteriales bacterium]|nr:DUF4377 domain-containing protein [Flavobacteriales bacterium]
MKSQKFQNQDTRVLSYNFPAIFTLLFLSVTVMLLSSCTQHKKNSVIWVSSIKTECSDGAGKRKCFSIHRGDSIDSNKWELFYAPIEDFKFEPGYFKKIEIQEVVLNQENMPADVSSIRYSLVKEIEKVVDRRFILNDIWVPVTILDSPISDTLPLPRMEIHLSGMEIMGTNGCNNYKGQIGNVTGSDISFKNIVSTKKMCLDMTIPDLYDEALEITESYKLENNRLILFDKEGIKTIVFKKVD